MGAISGDASRGEQPGLNYATEDNKFNCLSTIIRGLWRWSIQSPEQGLLAMVKQLPFSVAKITKDSNTLRAPGILIGKIAEMASRSSRSPYQMTLTSGLPDHVYNFYHFCAKPRGASAANVVRILVGFDTKNSFTAKGPLGQQFETAARVAFES